MMRFRSDGRRDGPVGCLVQRSPGRRPTGASLQGAMRASKPAQICAVERL